MAVLVNRSARWATVAVVASVGLLLTGCSGDGGDDGPTSATPTASVSPSASPSGSAGGDSGSPSASASGSYEPATSEGPAKNVPVPEMPEAVKEPTEEGLEAAVEYWWTTNFHLRETGDPAPFATVSSDDCKLCANQIDRWVKVYGDDAWIATDLASVKFQFTDFDEESRKGTTAFLVSEATGEIYLEGGEKVEEASGDGSEDRPWTAALHFDESVGHWMIDDIGTAS
ncbi:DUF6318 family protein [Microbacterium sp. A93]|uniref:DUF6318 family protein n=1 Tax=Microbacterium sp. A93 TaxID=3450716 RepID=UPI003F43E875